MNQISNITQKTSFVDQEDAGIPYSESTLQLQQRLDLRGGTIPT